MSVRLLRVRHIGRPVIVVAIPQWTYPAWIEEVAEWLALCRNAFAVQRVSAIPPYLRDDLGLPPEPLSRDWEERRRHPVDLTVLHSWRRR